MQGNVMLQWFQALVFGGGRRARPGIRIEPQMPASEGHVALAGLSTEDRAMVANELVNMRAFETFFVAAERQYGFNRDAMANRLQLMRNQDGWVTFKDGLTKSYAALEVRSQRVNLMGPAWDDGLVAEFRSNHCAMDDFEEQAEARRGAIRSCAWYQRKRDKLKTVFAKHRARQPSGSFVCSGTGEDIMAMLSDDASGPEIDELGKACGEMGLDEAISDCLDRDMHEVQVAAYQADPRFAQGLDLAKTMLSSLDDLARAVATVKLKNWSTEIELSGFCPNTHAFGIAREEAAKQLEQA